MTERIPGTFVPDTPIHRASLWMEAFKYGDAVPPREVETIDTEDYLNRLIEECDIDATPEQILEACSYYGSNCRRMLVGDRLTFTMKDPSDPTGEKQIWLDQVFAMMWFDAFTTSAAFMAGKRGHSREERKGLRDA